MSHIDHTYHVSGAKWLMGAALLEYVFYGVHYLIEGAKLQEYEGADVTAPAGKQTKEESKRPGADDDGTADVKDVELEENKGANGAEGTVQNPA